MLCLPAECPHCIPWGPSLPTKAKCAKPPIEYDTRPEHAYHNGWRYSTTLGGRCVTIGCMQQSLFDFGDPDNEEADE